jgi:Holliday junction resolvase RusA-like endonuclease
VFAAEGGVVTAEMVPLDIADDDQLVVFVPGRPVPKGSTKAFAIKANNRRGMRAVTTADNNADQKAWGAYIRSRVLDVWGARSPWVGPVRVTTTFVMPRRASAPKRSTPPHTRKPDGDKLTRCVWDVLTHVVWVDDAQVVSWSGSKREAEIGETPGVLIRVERLG